MHRQCAQQTGQRGVHCSAVFQQQPAAVEARETAQLPHLEGLSQEQLAAVAAPSDAHIRVVAGPGSGKTRVLTARVAHLLLTQTALPWEIMTITFTNKAGAELKERLERSLGQHAASQVTAGTFHSVASKILRNHIEQLAGCGRTSEFTIYDQEDGTSLLAGYVAEQLRLRAGVSSAVADKTMKASEVRRMARVLQNRISGIKGMVPSAHGFGAQELIDTVLQLKANRGLEELFGKDPELVRETVDALEWYEQQLRASNAVDFDDLLSLTVALFRDPAVVGRYQRKFRWILVDEFQDTNAAQYEFVRLLAAPKGHVFVVGDPDQAIYSWRGADPSKMDISFMQDFPGVLSLTLRDNYRSTPEVVSAAMAVLPTPQPLQPRRTSGSCVQVVESNNGYSEADWIAMRIRQLEAEGQPLSDMAVLFRIHVMSRVLEQALVTEGIKYVLLGGTPFWGRTEVKDVMSYLRLMSNLEDDAALRRIINVPARKLGPASIKAINTWAESRGQTLAAAIFDGCSSWQQEDGELPPLPPAKEMGLKAGAHSALRAFRTLICNARAVAASQPLDSAVLHIISKVEYEEHVKAGKCSSSSKPRRSVTGMTDEESRWANVMQVPVAAGEFASKPRSLPDLDASASNRGPELPPPGLAGLREFLQEAALMTGDDTAADAVDAVRLMTMHGAKGLEFGTVFIPGMEEGILPSSRAEDEAAVAEERRLAYVGATRAKNRLFLMHARRRNLWGGSEAWDDEDDRKPRSRFLDGLVPDLVFSRHVDDAQTYVINVDDESRSAAMADKPPPLAAFQPRTPPQSESRRRSGGGTRSGGSSGSSSSITYPNSSSGGSRSNSRVSSSSNSNSGSNNGRSGQQTWQPRRQQLASSSIDECDPSESSSSAQRNANSTAGSVARPGKGNANIGSSQRRQRSSKGTAKGTQAGSAEGTPPPKRHVAPGVIASSRKTRAEWLQERNGGR